MFKKRKTQKQYIRLIQFGIFVIWSLEFIYHLLFDNWDLLCGSLIN